MLLLHDNNEKGCFVIPPIESYFPNLMPFITFLVDEAKQGRLSDWDDAAVQVHAFFTAEMMDKMEATIPGWRHMSSYQDGKTLIHVMLVFASLLMRPEYQNANDQQQTIIKWIVLYHDLGKIIVGGRGDLVHGFRSATLVAQ